MTFYRSALYQIIQIYNTCLHRYQSYPSVYFDYLDAKTLYRYSKNNNNISLQDEKELSEGFSTVDVESEYTDDEESSDELFDNLTDDFEDNLLSDDGDGYEEEDEGFDDNM